MISFLVPVLAAAVFFAAPCPPLLFAQDAGAQEAPGTEAALPAVGPESAIILGEASPELPNRTGASAGLILRMLLVLLLAAAAVYGVVYFLKRASRPAEQRDPHVKILSSVHLGANRFVYVVSIGSRAWFLGGGDSGLNLIAELDDQDAINAMILAEERRGAQGAGGKFPDFKSMLRRLGVPVDNQVPGADNIRKRRERLKGFK